MSQNHQTSKYHTVIIAIGNGQSSHKDVINFIFSKIKSLCTPIQRYCGITKTFILSSFDIIAYIADRPERDNIINHLSSTGNFSKQSKHAAFIDANHMPSCDNCFKHLINCCINNLSGVRNCNRCIGWDFYARQKTKSYHLCPNKYLQSSTSGLPMPENRPTSETHIVPHQMTFDWMSKGIMLAEAELSNGTWKRGNAEIYLKTMDINDTVINNLWNRVQRKRKNEPVPEEFIPELWQQGYDIGIFIDSPMHLLFQGEYNNEDNYYQ